MKPQRIIWLDHTDINTDNGQWNTPESILALDGPQSVETVGYVIRETKEWLAIASSRVGDNWGHTTVIIKSCIVERNDLSKRRG